MVKLTQTLRVFSLLMFCLLFVNMASAFEFDNVKSYDSVTREVTIKNIFGLGADIGKARLNTPLNYKVAPGYQKVAEFDLWAYQDYNDILKSIDFYDKNQKDWKKNKISRTYDIKFKTQKEILVDDYKTECTKKQSLNGTNYEDCVQIKVGSHYETQEYWEKITPTDLKKNEFLTIGIFTDVQIGDYVEWIPQIYGVKIEEWATYEQVIDIFYNGCDTVDVCKSINNDYSITVECLTEFCEINKVGTKATGNNNPPQTITRNVAIIQNESILASKSHSYSGNVDYDYNFTFVSGDYSTNITKGNFTIRYWRSQGTLHDNQITTNPFTFDGNAFKVLSQQVMGTGDGFTFEGKGFYNLDNAPTITLNSPTVDANYTSPQTLTFNFTASDDIQLSDVKIYVNDILNQTNASGLNNTDYLFDLDLGDGDYTIYGKATDNNSAETNSDNVRIVIDSISPFINQSGLENLTTYSLPINSTWYLNASDTYLDKCYYNTTDHATSIVTCNSSINTTWATEGAKTITYCANDTFGNENCTNKNIYIYSLSENQADNPDPAVEGFDVAFNLTVNLTNITTTTAYLVLNDTIYNPTTTQANTNGYFFEVTFEVPDTWGNTSGITYDWYWNYTVDGVVTNKSTNTTNITVYELAIDDCSSYGDVILDMNLFDEETATAVNESAGARVEIDLTLTSKANSSVALTFNKTWIDENNPQVCIPVNVLNNTQWWLDFEVGFSSTDHVWEFYYLDDGTLNSSKIYDVQTSTPVYLMDLLTDDSTSFLFNYFDQDGLPVEDTIVHVYRKYIGEGVFREVERAKADLNGDTIVHLVEEDVIYYFVISQYGDILFTSSQYTALCQATPCTIQIEASGGSATFPTDWDLVDGGAYSISSSASTRQVNMTYELNESATMNLTIYKYNSDGSYSAINTSSNTGSSGSILMTVPQSAGNVSFFATVVKNDQFVNSEWVDFEGKAQDIFGITLALFISALIILSLGLFAVSEGVGTLVYVLLGVALSGFLGLITVKLSTGVNIVVYLIVAGGILLWKLTGGRR